MLGASFSLSLRRAAIALVFVSGVAGALSESAPALAAGPTIVDNGSMAPWIVKIAGSSFTPNNSVGVEITDIATGRIWDTTYTVASKQICLYAVNSPMNSACFGGGSFTYAYSPDLNCAPLGRDVTAWDFGSQKPSNKLHLSC